MDVAKLLLNRGILLGLAGLLAVGATCVAAYCWSNSWRGVLVAVLFFAALLPAMLAVHSAPPDEEDWWSPIWSAPPIVALYALTVVVLTASYLRGGPFTDVLIVLSASAAASLSGSLFGFIFAIPRSLQHSDAADGANDQFYAPNTNLEQISDWLTKILVGISLVQYREIVHTFDRAVGWMASALQTPTQPFFSGAILLAYAIAGFFCAYIWTRLRFTRDLTSLERNVRDSGEYLEGLANAYLYQSAPKGYTHSLKLSQRYLNKFGNDNDRVWLYVACGYGQKYRDLKLQYGDSASQEQKDELRVLSEQALKALERVKVRAPSQYRIVHGLWDKRDGTDDGDDLQAFSEDATFIAFFQKWKSDLDNAREA